MITAAMWRPTDQELRRWHTRSQHDRRKAMDVDAEIGERDCRGEHGRTAAGHARLQGRRLGS